MVRSLVQFAQVEIQFAVKIYRGDWVEKAHDKEQRSITGTRIDATVCVRWALSSTFHTEATNHKLSPIWMLLAMSRPEMRIDIPAEHDFQQMSGVIQ